MMTAEWEQGKGGKSTVAISIRIRVLQNFAWILFALLIVQYLLGMAVNLWVAIPGSAAGMLHQELVGRLLHAADWATRKSPTLLWMHAILGTLLAISSWVAVGFAVRTKTGYCMLPAFTGAISILAASINGLFFIVTGESLNSMMMAGIFMLALISYGALLYRLKGIRLA